MKFTKLGNIELTDLIRIDGSEYDSTQIKKVVEHGLEPSFEYDANINYSVNTICSKNGKWYVSLASNNLGNNLSDTTKWANYLQNNNVFMEWDSSLTYSQHAFVSYNGKIYKSLTNSNTNNTPTLNSAYWQEVLANSTVAGVNLVGDYNRDKIYNKCDTVRYWGTLWTCKNDNTYRQDPPLTNEITETDYWYLYLIDGQSASVSVGSITTVDYDVPAEVVNSGNQYQAVLDFTIPRGYDGKNAYEVWLQEGHEGTVDDFFNWLKDRSGLFSFTNDNLVDGVVTVPLTSSVVGVIDNTGMQWQLPQGSVLKTSSSVMVNLLGIMAMKNIDVIQGTWYIAVAGGVKGDSALSFRVGEITSVAYGQNPVVTSTTDDNGVVTFNMSIPRGRDAISFRVGTITVGNETNVTCTTSDEGVVTLDFELVEGVPGKNSYMYVAYASDNQGNNFSLVPTDFLKYRAEIRSETVIANPTASDFANAVWVKYIGDQGLKGDTGEGTWVYIAYARNEDGDDFSFEESEFRPYRAELRSKTEIPHIQESDFDGCKWLRFLGEKGDAGGVTAVVSATEPLAVKNGLIWIPQNV